MVRNDYKKYYDYIAKQKEDQIRAMNYLNEYIKEIIEKTIAEIINGTTK